LPQNQVFHRQSKRYNGPLMERTHMTNLTELADHIQAHPESTQSLREMIALYLADSTTADERRLMRTMASHPDVRLAYENLYFDGVGMNDPAHFVQQTLVAASLTRGYSSPEIAKQIIGELRVYADHHGVDVDAQLEAIRALPGAQRPLRNWRRFILVNALLLLGLALGTALAQTTLVPLLAQMIVVAVVMATQLWLLYRFYQR
jgi:hypothetical protein